MLDNSITVRQLNLYVKSLLENDTRLASISVTGEISNFKNHYASGHWYFTLKDNDASVRCVMFKSYAQKVGFIPVDGNKVTVRGYISLYERDGTYQFYASSLTLFGQGDISLKVKEIAEKLKKEGLFDEASKRPVAKFPKRIAVITSATGAAVSDICTTLNKRLPSCEVVICPVTVQGEGAAESMIKTLDRVYALSDIDTIIIGRGGGSSEDLSAFNDEALARKIYESPFPVISAVGHEIDVTICDFVADKRAATPTGAAVIACEDVSEYKIYIEKLFSRLHGAVKTTQKTYEQRLRSADVSRISQNALDLIERKIQTVDYLGKDMSNKMSLIISDKEKIFGGAVSKLDSLSPLKTLKRGYGVVSLGERVISSADGVKPGDSINVRLHDGSIDSEVKANERF
ncbi:MAG: exodeoxyribonuclease VII large subunit [Clostridia bacterium]|nr:exodeoxyribonuclease VII large subunit [Clostridia bacterium]